MGRGATRPRHLPFAIVGRLGRVAAYLDQAINALLAPYGLSRPYWDVLASLRRAGQPFELSPTDLYRGLMRSSGTMTHRLRRLESEGLIERVPDPADGRAKIIRLSERGREAAAAAQEIFADIERRFAAEVGDERFDEFRDTLRRLFVLTREPAWRLARAA
jgi:DNA-binding MarR family transcriptional regulator